MLTSVENITFNGVDLSELFNGEDNAYFIVNDVRGRGVIPNALELIRAPGQSGAYLSERQVPERVLEVDFTLKGNTYEDLRQRVEQLSAILSTDEVVPITFADEPGRTYYGILADVGELRELSRIHQATLTIICPDPYKYGYESNVPFNDIGTVHYAGTAPTYPNIKVEIKQDTTFVAVSNGEQINMIGNYGNVDEVPYAREERVFWDQMGTTVGWGATSVVEGGKIDGVMTSSGDAFLSRDYGTGTNWHGPAVKKSIGTTVTDFQLDALVRQIGSHGQVGSVEIMLLDVNNRVVAKLLMTKRSTHNQAVWAKMRFGNEQDGQVIMDTRGSADYVWQHFDGMLRIRRIGNVWRAYVGRYSKEKGWHSTLWSSVWIDGKGVATAPIAQVQVQLWQHGTTPATTTQRIDDIKIFKINNVPDGIPYVARSGDVIEFDHVNDVIYRNGEDIKKEKAFIGDYFDLKPGRNVIVAEPAEAIQNTDVRWRDKWR